MAPQVEVLENHRQTRAQALQFVRIADPQTEVVMAHVHRFAIEGHAALVGLFEKVDTAQEGALARAAGADQADHVTGLRLQRDTLEHMVFAVALVQVFDGQFVHAQALKGDYCSRR
ncbi:hypothetical protein D9M73_174970 [compost metagenome]